MARLKVAQETETDGLTSAEGAVRRLDPERIKLDPRAQARVRVSEEKISEYADAMREGHSFPPVVVFEDQKGVIWLADGFHRVPAAIRAGCSVIVAEVRRGDLRDAILFATGANAEHGLPRTHEDKRNAVMMLLSDEEWSLWSDRQIARQARVTAPTVGKYRAELEASRSASVKNLQMAAPESTPSPSPVVVKSNSRKVIRNGQSYVMQTGGISSAGKKKAKAAAGRGKVKTAAATQGKGDPTVLAVRGHLAEVQQLLKRKGSRVLSEVRNDLHDLMKVIDSKLK